MRLALYIRVNKAHQCYFAPDSGLKIPEPVNSQGPGGRDPSNMKHRAERLGRHMIISSGFWTSLIVTPPLPIYSPIQGIVS